MADKRFRGRDKIVQKMTKDGLVEENLRTGETKSAVEEEPPKQEDSEKDAAESAEETPVVEEEVCMDAEDGEEEKPRRSTAKQSTEYYKAHQEDGKAKEKDASPVDEDAEPAPKKKGHLSFDDEQQGGIVRGAGLGIKKVAKKGVDTATGFAHNKVHQVEKENSGVESAHKSEETLEELYRFSKGRKKTREKSARAEKRGGEDQKASRLKFSESEGGTAENAAEPSLKKKQPQPLPTAAGGEATKTVGSKFYQKKQYKDAYAAAKRGQKAGNAASKQAATAANTLAEKAKAAVQEIVVQNKTLWAGLGIAALVLMLIMGAFSSCSAAIQGTGSTFIGTTYPSKDADMKGAEEDYLEDEYVRPDAALTVISREQALRLFDEGKQIYLIRISPWPVLVTGREEIERGSDYFQIAKEDLEKDKQKAMENSEKAPVEKLAADLDDFAFDFDFYHYKDSVEDREQAVEALKEQIQAGDVQPIREWLQDAVEESEGESAEKAAELITRLDALVKEQKLLSGSEKQFGIYQITARDQEHDYRFMNLDFVKRHGMEVNRADYELIYAAPLTEKDTLDGIYERFNIQRPADFTGHSLSVSDVVVLNDGSTVKAYYVDSIGFAELPEFFKERNMDLQKENLLNEELQEIEIFDKPGLFSNGRLRDEEVPKGLYRYDLRGSDYDPGQPITVEKNVVVNHAASVLMAEELDLGADGRLELGEEGLNFTGAELTVREFMEEQQQKRSGLIHGDSDHIAVEGHIGTWYAVDETEIGGEKFFLLEHEEHGDMAACVAVNEQGKLVAEDLWNGFDEDFQEAVQKYLSEKWNMPKKENVVAEIIEKAAPVPDNSAQDYSDVPVYYEPFSYAKENDEVDLYRTSYRLNSECKQAIQEAIADNYDGMYLGDGAVDQVVRQYGMERVGYILANTLHHKSCDGRFSPGNKKWAEQVSTPEHNADRMTFRTDWVVDSHPAILDGFATMFREELDAQKELEQERPFVKQFYVVENLQAAPLKIERFGNLDDAMSQYQALPSHYMKALGVEKNPDPLPGSLDILQCRNGIDTIVEDYKAVPGWDNQYIQNHVVQPLQGALAVQDVELAYELPDAYFHIQTCDDGFDYTLYNKDFTVMDGGIVETDEYRPVQEVMEEVLAEHGHSISECGVISAEYLQEQSYRAETQRAEAMKEKLAAEKPAPEASISFYVAECAEFPVMGEFHDNLTLEQALEVYDKIPAERMNGIKSIGFSLEDGSIYSGMFDLMVGGEVQAEVVNHIQHYRESPLVQKAISDMKTLLEKRQASKELEERPNTRQSVREALKNRKKAQEQQSNQEQAKPKKAKKKGEMEL